MRQPQRLLADLSDDEVVDFLTIPARSSGLHDLSTLVELHLAYQGDHIELGSVALNVLLQASSPAAVAPAGSNIIFSKHLLPCQIHS